MKSVIESFGIPYNSLTGLLTTFDGCIAGSSALYGYLSETETPSWQPNDMDIWIKVPGLSTEHCRKGFPNEPEVHELLLHSMSMKRVLRAFMKRFDYQSVTLGLSIDRLEEGKKKGMSRSQIHEAYQKEVSAYLQEKNAAEQIIHSILYFSKDDKKVQIILTSDITRDELLENFDMSVCGIAWDPETGYATSLPQALYDAKHKRTDYKRSLEHVTERTNERIKKYRERGFKIYVPL